MKNNKKKQKKGLIGYPVGDFLIRLKNAAIAGHKEIESDNSKLISSVAACLKKASYLESMEVKGGKITVALAFRRKEPLLMDVKIVSKPGLRVYMGLEDVEKKKGPSIMILSTPIGVVTAKDAIKSKVGGEVIAEIY